MTKDIKEYVRHCGVCQRTNYRREKPAGLLQPLPVPDRRWDSISMDFVVELPSTRSGHDAMLVFVDRLTKTMRIAPTTTEVAAEGIADLLVNHVLKNHGMPREIISDRDSRFSSRFFRRLAEKWGIRQSMSTAFHPQTDGQREVMNRIVEDYLRAYAGPVQDDWDERLPMAEFAMNNSRNESTGETPFFLNYGEHPRTPETQDIPILRAESSHRADGREQGQISDQIPAVERIAARVQEGLRMAKQHLEAARDRQQKYAERHCRDVSYREGEQVLLSSKNISLKHPGTRKLLPRWLGPFPVERRVSAVAYRLTLPPTMSRLHPVFHVSKLAPYRTDGRCQPPPPVELDGELEYEVEKLLDKRIRRRGRRDVVEYLIKWLNYPHEHDSWEPVTNLTHCDDLLHGFERDLHEAGHVPGVRRNKRLRKH